MIRLIQNKDENNPSLGFLNKFKRTIVTLKNTSNNTLNEASFKRDFKKYYQDIATSTELFQKKIMPIINKYDILNILKINVALQAYIVEFMSNFNVFIQENIQDALKDRLEDENVLKEEKIPFSEGFSGGDEFNIDPDDGIIINTLKVINGTIANWTAGINQIGANVESLNKAAQTTFPAVNLTWDYINKQLNLGENIMSIFGALSGGNGKDGQSIWSVLFDICKNILLGNKK